MSRGSAGCRVRGLEEEVRRCRGNGQERGGLGGCEGGRVDEGERMEGEFAVLVGP